jgi:signal transduction histidine kinase
MQRLISFEGNLPQLLGDWRQENPLVRNVFIWRPGTGLSYPNPEMPASDEEQIFIRRYLPLFSGELDWQQPTADRASEKGTPAPAIAADSILSERKVLRELASRAPLSSEPVAAQGASSPPGRSGWRSWYADDQLHLIGWYQPADKTIRYGVEIEMMALLSRLLGSITPAYGTDESLALLDGSNHIFHQSGPFEVTSLSKASVSRPLSALPHWQLNLYRSDSNKTPEAGFFLIGSLLTGSFIAAILLGGSLLLWQAVRNHREARQKTSFVSNVSHELKTPLTTIRMYAELLGEGKIDSALKQKTYLQTIIRESQRLTRLVNNILDFSRLEQGHKTFNFADLEFNELLEDILARQALRCEEAGLILKKQLAPDALPIYSDPDAIEQILLNLIDNALKYAAKGGELLVVLSSDTEKIYLELSDRGPGIPKAQHQKIFDKFHRLDSSLTSSQPGAGLGLSIARQLARGLRGDLICRAVDSGGASFCLSLPRGGVRS